MYIQEIIASRNFKGRTSEEAYRKANKWIYNNLYSMQDEISEKLSYAIERVENGDLPTCRLSVYCLLDEEKELNSMCETCKDLHKLFYLNKKDECGTCKILPYRKRIQERIEIKRGFYIERIFKGKVKRKKGDDRD